MTQPIAYSYVRFSSRKQGKGSSLHRQTEDTVAGESPASWCARNGVVFDTSLTYRDLGVSAYTGRNARQGELRAFLDAVASGRIRRGSYLLVERVDRITRQGVDEGMDVIKQILRAGVSIVTLANGRVYGPDAVKGLMKGLLELQMYLEQAQQFSEALSARVSAAWEGKRKKARAAGTLATASMPPWLEVVGEGDGRRAVVVPGKVAVVRRIFDMVIAGHGITRVVRALVEDGTPPVTRRNAWSRTGVRRILADRAVLGEYQPMRGRAGGRVADGPPVENYFPAIISPDTFHRARACLGDRKTKNVGRESKVVNVFSGLLKDARNGESYIPTLRIERLGRRHHALQSAGKTGGANSFPFEVFEAAILAMLEEIDPRELLPPAGQDDEVLALSIEFKGLEGEVAAIAADMDREYSDTLHGVLRRKEARKKAVASRLAEARLRAASPAAEAWGEAKGLLETLGTAPDRSDALRRLRAVLRRLVESIRMLVVPRGRDRLCAAQVWFTGGEKQRSYLILHRPPKSNGKSHTEGSWWARSFKDVLGVGSLDLRDTSQVRQLERALAALPIDAGCDND